MTDHRLPDDWTVIVETHDGPEADVIQGRLHEDGIDAVVLESRAAPGAWLTGSQPHWAPKSIAVPVAQADRAFEILDAEPDEQDEYDVDDVTSTIGTLSEPLDGSHTMLGGMRLVAWVIAAIVVVPILFSQCQGTL